MTNELTYPLRGQTRIRILPQPTRAEREAYRRSRRRKALWNTVSEALATFGIVACMFLCAAAIVCVV